MATSPRASGTLSAGKISYQEVKEHNTNNDCWMIICGKVYDLTSFANEHPGGAAVVTEQAGLDATEPFLHAHPESIMKLTLGPEGLAECYIGEVDMATVPDDAKKAPAALASPAPEAELDPVPPIDAVLNLHDFEAIAQNKMLATGKKQAWDYYSSGADDELTYNENVNAFQRVWLKPRVMVNVEKVETATTMLGVDARFPVYLSAVAMCGMGHSDGECAWMKGAFDAKVPFMIPNLSSKPLPEILASAAPGQQSWFQIYVNPSKDVVKEQLETLEAAGIKCICLTVDSAVPGKRERDLRNKIAQQLGQQKQQQAAAKNTKARKAGNYANRDPKLNWDDLEWFKKNTTIPIVLKGVQCAEDAILAAQAGCKGIILSNHGGRNLDTSRSGIEILPEVMQALKENGLDDKLEVYVDGGVRRGTDILKALALGAKGVGLGKPAVYSMSAYGSEGITKMLDVLYDEFIKAMQLCGAASIKDLKPSMLNIDSLTRHMDVAPIPPSPYAAAPAPKNVRNPKSKEDKTVEELEAELKELQARLAKKRVDSGLAERERHGSPMSGFGNVMLFAKAMAVGLACTIFSNTPSGCLHRSALFLFLFLIMHAVSNATVFLGEGPFNTTVKIIRENPLHTAFEYYLLAGACVHTLAALYFTKNKVNYIMKNPLQNGKLLLSSIVIVLFLAMHLDHFRFSDIQTNATGHYDFYAAVMRVFADPINVALYAAGSVGFLVHLQAGWPKTVLKMSFPEQQRKVITSVGLALITPLCVLYCVIPVLIHVTGEGYAVQQ
eukprot:TRINITY_DN17600_c0_g2_i1.p1 TRINITY_DN17600_c0_g2~~TRINITY_DN17600_c0_g2_i1.p1  ORF type:complete len:780 (+),score=335.13 TRINITY_DN17600_c0_g2_i1:45-2384(+)